MISNTTSSMYTVALTQRRGGNCRRSWLNSSNHFDFVICDLRANNYKS